MFKYLFTILASMILTGCLISDDSDSSEPNITKSEEYQFAATALEALFLYRDSLPEDYYAFNSIEELYYSVTEPYTRYYDPIISIEINKILTTVTAGIGVYVDSVNSGYVIFDVVPGSPADLAGILINDTIIKVDGTSLIGATSETVQSYLFGDVGESHSYTINRAGSEIVISVTMSEFLDRSVFTDSLSDEIAVITLSTFSATTYMEGGSAAEFRDALNKTVWADWTIFDLRQNTGGRLDQCISITSEFVDSGLVLLNVRERDYDYVDSVYKTMDTVWLSDTGQQALTRKFYILMDSSSASASEVVIAGLRKHRPDIKTVGGVSYGKGRGQYFVPTPLEGIARITAMKMTPGEGEPYDMIGITPDVLIDDVAFALDTAVMRITGGSREVKSIERKRRNRRIRIKQKEILGPVLYKRLNKIN